MNVWEGLFTKNLEWSSCEFLQKAVFLKSVLILSMIAEPLRVLSWYFSTLSMKIREVIFPTFLHVITMTILNPYFFLELILLLKKSYTTLLLFAEWKSLTDVGRRMNWQKILSGKYFFSGYKWTLHICIYYLSLCWKQLGKQINFSANCFPVFFTFASNYH